MNFSKVDLRQIDNLVKALKKGNFTLDGMEVLAMSDAMKWLNNLHLAVVEEIKKQEELDKVEPQSLQNKTEKVEFKKKKK